MSPSVRAEVATPDRPQPPVVVAGDSEVARVTRKNYDTDWMDRAACKGQLRLFFCSSSESAQSKARREKHAMQLCDSCPVRDNCRDYATALNHATRSQLHGFWAGRSFDPKSHRSRVA